MTEEQMKEILRLLSLKNIYVGTSSWKYRGWEGLIYKRSYSSEKAFAGSCLEEYATVFSAVGVDHTYYAWPTEKGFARYDEQTPPHFRFGLKVTDRTTVAHFPNLPRYGKDAGKQNPDFLNPVTFRENFLKPLLPFKEKVGVILFEFSQFYFNTFSRGSEFIERLDSFLEEIGTREWNFAVEIRNRNWLKEKYFECLLSHGVSHVFSSWSRMPELDEQLALSEPYDFPFLASRILLQPGTKYEEAVEAFSPYDKIRESAPRLQTGAASIISKALQYKKPAYLFVNNRAEGSAPLTIMGILERIENTERS